MLCKKKAPEPELNSLKTKISGCSAEAVSFLRRLRSPGTDPFFLSSCHARVDATGKIYFSQFGT